MVKLSQSQTGNRKGRGRRKSWARTGVSCLQCCLSGCKGRGSSQQMSHCESMVSGTSKFLTTIEPGPLLHSCDRGDSSSPWGTSYARGLLVPPSSPEDDIKRMEVSSRCWNIGCRADSELISLAATLPPLFKDSGRQDSHLGAFLLLVKQASACPGKNNKEKSLSSAS